MNFFENQDKARKKTSILVLYFFLALLLIILAINILVVGFIVFIETQNKPMLPTQQIITLFIEICKLVSPIVIGVIVLGSVISFIRLRHGGIAVAEMVKARPIDYNTSDFLEKRFINIVEEMSIASGVAIPQLYVMDEEPGINAFVAGIKPKDTVMVVTQGALRSLSRQELQGVIGHEYSHILNSDMLISVRLIVILAGILMISQTGYNVMRVFGRTRVRVGSNNKSNFPVVIFLFGLGLLLIGSIGVFFGRLIKAGISRQRELLADASSVGYTRDPEGLVNALRRIQASEISTHLKSNHAEDISHLCFTPSMPVFLASLLATHPPLEKRIQLLDPDGIYSSSVLPDLKTAEQVETQTKKTSIDAETILGAATVIAASTQNEISAKNISKSIGQLTQENITYAKILIEQIPETLLEFAHDPQRVGMLLFAFTLPKNVQTLAKIQNHLKEHFKAEELSVILQLNAMIAVLDKSCYLPLIDIALPSFKQNPRLQRQEIYAQLEEIAAIDKLTLFEFVFLTLIGKAIQGPHEVIPKTKYQDFSPVTLELSALMALLVNYSQVDEATKQKHFQQAMQQLIDKPIAMIEKSNLDISWLRGILAKLNQLSPLCKEKVITAAISCIESDQKVTPEEAELIRAIAACLDCPIPPIVPQYSPSL
jgi:Zn-dependent protease with chaperone function